MSTPDTPSGNLYTEDTKLDSFKELYSKMPKVNLVIHDFQDNVHPKEQEMSTPEQNNIEAEALKALAEIEKHTTLCMDDAERNIFIQGYNLGQNSANSYSEGSENVIYNLQQIFSEPSSVEKPDPIDFTKYLDEIDNGAMMHDNFTFQDGCGHVWSDFVMPARKRIQELTAKELRADRMIVDLEHEKTVLKARIRELEAAINKVTSLYGSRVVTITYWWIILLPC